MSPVIILNDTTARMPYGSTIYSSHIATLHIPGLSKQARQIQNFSTMKTAQLISLGFICYDGCTITLYKQDM